MKKIIGVVLGITVCLFFFVSLSLAHDLIATDPPYDCAYLTHTNCQECHVGRANTLYNFVYSGHGTAGKTRWHGQHWAFANTVFPNTVCATCHTGAVNSCASEAQLVETKNCKICHNLTPPTLLDPNPPYGNVTPAAVSLPCGWVNNHDIAHPERGTNCLSCHTTCTTAIELSSFNATILARKVIIVWKTESEIVNAGFNIYRSTSENGEYEKINASLIPAKGSAYEGASYGYVDKDVQKNITYYYKLEDIDISGTSTFHGPIVATPKRGR